MGRIIGDGEHKGRLQRMRGPVMAEAMTQAVFLEAQALQVDAQISITTGAVSGAKHVASTPGTPPNNDTGVLAGNIEAVVTGVAKAETSSNAPYAAAQEFGQESTGLPERPYMRPAAARSKEHAPRRIADAFNRVIRHAT